MAAHHIFLFCFSLGLIVKTGHAEPRRRPQSQPTGAGSAQQWFCAVKSPGEITSKTSYENVARQSLGVGKEGDVFAVFPMNDQKALGPDVAINWKRDGPLTWTKWPTIVNLRQTCEKAELPPPVVCTTERRTDRPGNLMKSIPNVQNQGQCAKLCKETEGCKALTFLSDKKQCNLKNGVPEPKRNTRNRMSSICRKVRTKRDVGYDRPGLDIRGAPFKETTFDRCLLRCIQKHSNCVAITYRPSTNDCWPKHGAPNLKEYAGLVSAKFEKDANGKRLIYF